jgi:hypothetical protein
MAQKLGFEIFCFNESIMVIEERQCAFNFLQISRLHVAKIYTCNVLAIYQVSDSAQNTACLGLDE